MIYPVAGIRPCFKSAAEFHQFLEAKLPEPVDGITREPVHGVLRTLGLAGAIDHNSHIFIDRLG